MVILEVTEAMVIEDTDMGMEAIQGAMDMEGNIFYKGTWRDLKALKGPEGS